jgi:formate hydrogenlyase subunit 3/multisubunit Na+/H+ antiporter MnhD subunit
MQQGQLLLFIIALFPILSWLSLSFFKFFPRLYNFSYCLFPILYFLNLFQATKYFSKDIYSFTIIEAMRGLSMAVYVDKLSLIFLIVMTIIWAFFAFYSVRYFSIISNKLAFSINNYFILIIGILNLLIISKNLFTILFFYIILIICSYLLGIKYLNYIESKYGKLFNFALYLESFLLFIATVLSFKINGQIEFIEKIILPNNFDQIFHGTIFLLFFFGLFLIIILPFYLFFTKFKFNSIVLISLFLLSYAFPSAFIFIKILNYIYGIKGFNLIIKTFGFSLFNVIILINLLITAYKLIKSSDIKSSSLYLFLNQFLFLIFSLLVHATYKINFTAITLIAFLLNFMVIFFCTGNYELFIEKSSQKKLEGIFYYMPLTTIIYFFGLLSLIGISPSFSMVDKYFILINLFKNHQYFSLIIFLINNFLIGYFIFKKFKLLVHFDFSNLKNNLENKSENNNFKVDQTILNFARKIDFDSSLILTILLLSIMSFIGLIFFSFVTQFISFYE